MRRLALCYAVYAGIKTHGLHFVGLKCCKKTIGSEFLCRAPPRSRIFAFMLRPATSVFFFKVFAALLNFFVIVLLSQKLGVADRGVCAFYLVVVALALAFTDLVAGASLGNLLQQFDLRQIRQLSLVWGALVSVLVCVVLFAFGKLGFTETALLALACWLNGAVSFLQQALLCKQQYAKYNMANLLPAFLVALFCAVFAFSGLLSTSSYLVALCLGWMATAWRAFGWLGEPTVSPNRAHFKLLLRSGLGFAVPNQVAHLLGLLNGRLPYFFVSAAALGVFSNAQALADAMLLLPGSLGQVLYAQSVRLEARSPSNKVLAKALWQNFLGMAALYGVAALLPAEVYTGLFGSGFEQVKALLWLLGLGSVCQSGYLVLSYWQSARGHFDRNIYPLLLSLLWNSLGCIWLSQGHSFSVNNLAMVLAMGSFWAMVAAFIIQKITAKDGAR